MSIPDILKGGVHLPLTVSTTSAQAIALANGFYQTELDVNDYKETQAFWGVDNVLQLDLIDPESGEVLESFYNRSTGNKLSAAAEPMLMLSNPMDPSQFVSWMGPVIVVHDAKELEFLSGLGSGNTYPIFGVDNNIPYQLSSLLNSYQFIGSWVSGTMGEYATGGFTLVYLGPSSEAPEELLVDYSPNIAVIQINHGEQKGYICLRT
jgi:hypothetical protein